MVRKIQNIKFYHEKKRFILFALLLFGCLFLSFQLFKIAYARYQSDSRLRANIDKAIYLLEAEELSFNIDSEKIVPSTDPYIYKFSVSNFSESKSSDIDISYGILVTTTTNLPLTIQLYRNENHDDPGASNLVLTPKIVQDGDGAWYKVYDPETTYTMNYSSKVNDIYVLAISFPKVYSSNTNYADCIENIEVKIKSRQITE